MPRSVSEILTELKALDRTQYPVERARELIIELGRFNLMIYTMNPGKKLTRARNGKGYTLSKEISYPPTPPKKCGRANLRNVSMFYGCVVHEKAKFEETRQVTCMEVTNLFNSMDERRIGTEHFTFGRWAVTKPINLVAIVQSDRFNIVNPLLSDMNTEFQRQIAANPDNLSEVSEMANFFAAEFSNENLNVNNNSDFDYLLTATFADIVINEFGYDGVLYPSVRGLGGNGLNVVIKEDTARDNLTLECVGECTFYARQKKYYLDFDRCGIAYNKGKQIRFIANSSSSDSNLMVHLGANPLELALLKTIVY